MFLSKTCFGTEFRSCCLFRGMARNRIPSICLYFCSTERNSEFFPFPRNGSERNSERLFLILVHGIGFRAFFSSAERFGTEFREFSFLRNSRNSAGTNQCSVYSVFRRINFLSEIANPNVSPSPSNLGSAIVQGSLSLIECLRWGLPPPPPPFPRYCRQEVLQVKTTTQRLSFLVCILCHSSVFCHHFSYLMPVLVHALKKISVMHVIKLGFAPVSFPPG
jgi:hypothetical protein